MKWEKKILAWSGSNEMKWNGIKKRAGKVDGNRVKYSVKYWNFISFYEIHFMKGNGMGKQGEKLNEKTEEENNEIIKKKWKYLGQVKSLNGIEWN